MAIGQAAINGKDGQVRVDTGTRSQNTPESKQKT